MTIGSNADLVALRRVGRLVAETIQRMREAVRPGVTTAALDDIARRYASAAGARSAPQLAYGFPGFTCISVNDAIVHGIPGPRSLAPGDVVKLDVTLDLDGYVADSAVTVLVPPVAAEAQRMQRVARVALNRAIDAARAGAPLSAIGRAVEAEVRRGGFAVVRELTGHGVGRRIHEPPTVANYFDASDRAPLTDGLVLAIEPMVTARATRVVEDGDGWTLRTMSGGVAVHQEHTVVVRRGAAIVLTAA